MHLGAIHQRRQPLPEQFFSSICIQNSLQAQIKMSLFFKPSDASKESKCCSRFERKPPRWSNPGRCLLGKRFLLRRGHACAAHGFHRRGIFRTCCREEKISVSGAQEAARREWKRSGPPGDHWHLIFLSASPELQPNRLCPTTWRSSGLKQTKHSFTCINTKQRLLVFFTRLP